MLHQHRKLSAQSFYKSWLCWKETLSLCHADMVTLKSAPDQQVVFSLAPFTNCDIILLECMHFLKKNLFGPYQRHRLAGVHYVSHGKLSRSLTVLQPAKHSYRHISTLELKAQHICSHLFVCYKVCLCGSRLKENVNLVNGKKKIFF